MFSLSFPLNLKKSVACKRPRIFLLHGNVQFSGEFGLWAKGGLALKRKLDGAEVLRKIAELAFDRANDAAKLALLDPGQIDLDKLDLTLLSEVKRGNNGVVEVKLLSRLDALALLAKLIGADGGRTAAAESFFQALDEAAKGQLTINREQLTVEGPETP